MKGFIELTECESGCKVLYALEKIQAVVSDGEDTFIEMDVDSKRSGAGVGVYVRERYEEVKARIAEACSFRGLTF